MNENMLSVRYIGPRKKWTENIYGSGLAFTNNQQRMISEQLAKKLLRHADLFEAGDTVQAEGTTDSNQPDDTAEQLAQAQQNQDQAKQEESERQDLVDRIMLMDKDALGDFALSNYEQNLNKRRSVENLREQVVGFVDRFGVV